MKNLFLLLGFMAVVCNAVPAPRETDFDNAHRFIFYAVLEGCFEEGLSTEDVSQILLRREKESYFHFIYSCPVCMPAVQAFETYRSRPEVLFSVKNGASTFGSGLKPEVKLQLFSTKPEDRLEAINSLVQSWIAKRMKLVALSDLQRNQLRLDLEDKRKKGMEALKNLKANGSVAYHAPAFAQMEECAVCNAAVGKKFKMPSAP